MSLSRWVFKKKLFANNPKRVEEHIEVQLTTQQTRSYRCDPTSIEHDLRQILADKASGNGLGVWLLIPEYLRLGTWDLLCAWTGSPTQRIEPRIAMQLVNEAAMCTCSTRAGRSLNQPDFTLANGMAFLACDSAVHNVLNAQTVESSLQLQIALGLIRKTMGDFPGQIIAIDPHRMHSCSRRHMRLRKPTASQQPAKCIQTFFCFDTQSQQPIAFLLAGPAANIHKSTNDLLDICQQILNPSPERKPLVLGDAEHHCCEIFSHVHQRNAFDMLCPMPRQPAIIRQIQQTDPSQFNLNWAGYATMQQPYTFKNDTTAEPYHMIVQRCGEIDGQFTFKPFAATRVVDAVDQLTIQFPMRWDIEQFFKNYQDLGWKSAGTLNLHIRYAQTTMSLLAQAAIARLRTRLPQPINTWDSMHLARNLFCAMDGDVRVKNDTITVTYYNAPNTQLLKPIYEQLPQKLESEGIRPNIPWLLGFKLDFRFR